MRLAANRLALMCWSVSKRSAKSGDIKRLLAGFQSAHHHKLRLPSSLGGDRQSICGETFQFRRVVFLSGNLAGEVRVVEGPGGPAGVLFKPDLEPLAGLPGGLPRGFAVGGNLLMHGIPSG